jgi:hypothetical protein
MTAVDVVAAFHAQIDELRSQIDLAVREGSRVRIKLYVSDSVAPAQFQAYAGQPQGIGITVSATE